METSQDKITFELLYDILSNHTKDLNISESEFVLLKSIKPKRFTLPVSEDSHAEIIHIGGDSVRNGGGEVKAGAYKFTNKIDGYSYIGSSTQLASRLKYAYFSAPPRFHT